VKVQANEPETEELSAPPSPSGERNSSFFTLHPSLSKWYTVDGRKLAGKPTQKGVYIYKGKKLVVD
jgi:hypothetical protein